MKSKLIRPPGLLLKTGLLVFFAMTLVWLPQANAAVSEGATIENVATVTWDDVVSSGNPAYTATAFSQVTVNLVEAATTLSGRPTGTDAGDTAARPAGLTVMSTTNADYLYAVTANANGSDSYSLSASIASSANVTGPSITWELTDAAGTVPGAFTDPASVTLGSAIVAVDSSSADTLSFPGGSLAGFADGDIVVINGVDYAIDTGGISVGVAPDHGSATTETLATIRFIANADGSNTAPAFGGGAITAGTVVGEQQLFYVRVSATFSSAPATVNHDVTIDTAPNVINELGVVTTFEPLPTVSITKEVRNITDNTAWDNTNSTSGDPGDIFEYRLTISNAGSTAEAVVVTDPVPTYTSLQTFLSGTGYPDPTAGPPSTTLGNGSGAATDVFAQIHDSSAGPATINLTVQNTDDESATLSSGDSTGTVAGSTLTFYVGGNSVNASAATTGGDIRDSTATPADVFLIHYRVRILP